MTAPLDQAIQGRLRALGATDEQIARLGSLNNQRAIEWDNLFGILVVDSNFLVRLLSVFVMPTSPVRPGP